MKDYIILGTNPVTFIGSCVPLPASEFNAATRWLFWNLMEYRGKDNKVKLKITNRTDANRMATGYKVLFDLGWIRRTQRQHYFINPDIALSSLDLYWDLKKEWDNGIT